MNSATIKIAIQLLAFGLILAFIKLVCSFFDPYSILDIIVFVIAGFALGGKVPSKRWPLGLLLSLPAVVLCLFFVVRLGYSQIVNGVGTSYAISLVLIPFATLMGLFIQTKRARKKTLGKNE